MLEVLWTPTPGARFSRLSHNVLSNTIGCPCHKGLFFEAYQPKEEKEFNFRDLKSKAATVQETDWAGWTPIVQHAELQGRIWYPDDSAFVREIPVFKEKDKYVLRWRGQVEVSFDGIYTFRTNSDDGSLLYVDGNLVVNNDGLHGATTKVGKTKLLKAGLHDITIAFFENGGRSVLEVSWTPNPSKSTLVPLSYDVLSNKIGCGNSVATGSWKLLYRQTGASSLGKEKWKSVNPGKPTSPNYSILGTLSDKDKVNGKFTFKLVYPKSREPNAYNIWKQSSNPITDKKVKGYQEIRVNMKWNH